MRKKVLKWSRFFKIELRIRTDNSLQKCPGEPSKPAATVEIRNVP
jgi:hypothetical protein